MREFNQTVCIYLDLLGFSDLTLQKFKIDDYFKFKELVAIMRREIRENSLIRLNYVSFFSDSFLWLFSYNNMSNVWQPSEFDACLLKIQGDLVWLLSDLLEKGLFFRGGIAFGRTLIDDPHVNVDTSHNSYASTNIIFSEALVKASKIEKTIKYPIIGLDKDTVDLIYNLHDGGCGKEYVSQFKDIIKPLSLITKKESDSEIYFLDHLFLIIDSISYAAYDFMLLHKEFIIDQLQTQTNKKILEKYNFLVKYHNYALDVKSYSDEEWFNCDDLYIEHYPEYIDSDTIQHIY